MSRIYFHSEDDTAELRGSERAYMGGLCTSLFMASIGRIWDSKENPSWLRKYIPPDHYALNPMLDFEKAVDTWLRVSNGNLIIEGKEESLFSIALNTAFLIGNDIIKLCARLHGQCEIHCYVEGPNRAWLAGMMEQGRKLKIFRPDQGWERVIALLRVTDAKPVVTSYSVTEQFPNAGVAIDAGLWEAEIDDEGYQNWDKWYEMPREEQWQLAMTALRSNKGGLELTPDGWETFYFAHGITGFDLKQGS